ncbi:MAG: hypothetical protein KJZ64_05340 [Sphingomonadaceae bacterium]|nr:hypothetical protein [Sphingomonadaceae bacterium]
MQVAKGFVLAALAAVGFSAIPAAAQTAVAVKAGKVFKHEHSKIVIPARLGGIERSGATDFSKDFLDVAIRFDTADGQEGLSVYVFRDTIGTVPVWFSQAQLAIEARDIYAGPIIEVAPEVIALPGSTGGEALRVIYRGGAGSEFSSTGLAFFSLGAWYIKVRASSKTRSAANLAIWMEQAISELTLPAKLEPSKALAPVAACDNLLAFPQEAEDAPVDGAASLLNGVLGMMVANGEIEEGSDEDDEAAQRWCRDATISGVQTLYRPGSATDRYMIALGDSGRGVFVGPDAGASLMAATSEGGEKGEQFAVTYHLPDAQISYVAQDRLPSPQRVTELINGNRSTMSVSTWGKDKTVRLNSKAM